MDTTGVVEPERSPKRSDKKPFWKFRSFKIITGIVVVSILLLIFVPIGVRMYLEKWLVENGADTATIEKVKINPFTGVAALQGVDVQKDGRTVFGNSTIYINIGLKNLFGKEANLEKATLADVVIDIEQTSDSFRIGSYSITATENTTVAQTTEERDESLPWIFRAAEVSLNNVQVLLKTPELNIDLIVEEATIQRFDTDPDGQNGDLKLRGTLNGAPIYFDLNKARAFPNLELGGEVDISKVRLDDLEQFLSKYLNPFRGTAALKGLVDFVMNDAGLRVNYDGTIALEKGDIAGQGWATKGTVTWDGKAGYEMGEETMVVSTDGELRALEAGYDMPAPFIDIDNSNIGIIGKTIVTIGEEVVVDSTADLELAPTIFSMDTLQTTTGEAGWQGTIHVATGTQTKGLQVNVDGKLSIIEPGYTMDMGEDQLAIANKLLEYKGQVKYAMGAQPDDPSIIRTYGELIGEDTNFSLPQVVQLEQGKLHLSGKSEVTLGENIDVTYDGTIKLGGSHVDLSSISFSDEQLVWSGAASYSAGQKQQNVSLNGTLEGQKIATTLHDTKHNLLQESLNSTLDLSLTIAEPLILDGTAQLTTGPFTVKEEETPLVTVKKIAFDQLQGDAKGGASVAALTLSGISVPSSAKIQVGVEVDSIGLNGLTSSDLKSSRAENLIISQPVVLDADTKTTLAKLDDITVTEIAFATDLNSTIKSIRFNNGQFLQEEDKAPTATLKTIAAHNLTYNSENGLELHSIEVDSLFGGFVRAKTDETAVAAEEQKEATPPEDSAKEPQEQKLPIRIGEIQVVGKSGMKFTDKSLTQPFSTEFLIDSLTVKEIDLNDPLKPFSYNLKGSFDKYAPLSVSGSSTPLAKEIVVDQEVRLKNYPMPQLSPYVIEYLGTYFESGRLDFTSTLKLSEGYIDMENNLQLKEADSETADEEIAAELNNQLPVSLDLALAMLKDSNDTIDLDVPISGKLTDMNIGFSDLIITPLSKGITLAVTPYLAYTFLGPTGALIYAGAKVGEALLDTNLPTLEFEPGQTDITDAHHQILEEVGNAIIEDTKNTYSICAKVNINEIGEPTEGQNKKNRFSQSDEERKQLFELGEKRSNAVKEYLQTTFKIEDEKLLICSPGMDFSKEGKPRVEFKK